MIGPDIALRGAADPLWDVVVVGAGPAGAMAALGLARRGCQTLLVDRSPFPRAKVCGCCLNGRALSALSLVGLGELPERLGAVPLRSLRCATAQRSALIPLAEGSAALSRSALDTALVEEARRAGAVFLPQTRVGPGEVLPGRRELALRQPGETVRVAARVVVTADGLGGHALTADAPVTRASPGSHVGAGAISLSRSGAVERGAVQMLCTARGYLGMVVIEDGSLNLAAALDPHMIAEHGGLAAAVSALFSEVRAEDDIGLRDLDWRGTPALTRRTRCVGMERAFIVGDAAGYVEPFTGEGIAWALTGGTAVAPIAAAAAERWDPSLVRRWTARHRHLIARRQRVCRLVAAGLRQPWLLNGTLALLNRRPGLAAPVMRHVNQPLPSGRITA